jgi:hypothetical protein
MMPAEPHWTAIASTLLTPVIGIGVGAIAWLQWRTNQNKLKLDLFEKRYAVYRSAREFLGIIIRDGVCNHEDVGNFVRSVQDKEFLLSKDLSQYLDEFRTKGMKMAALVGELKRTPVSAARSNLVNEIDSLLGWFLEQSSKLGSQFESHLRLTH